MDTDNEEEELYSHRLKEVFDSCDLANKGYINRNEVIDLSQKLQCGDQVPELLRETLGDEFTDGKVTFQQFRDGFVNILAKTIDGLVDTTITDEVTDPSEFSEFTDFSLADQCVPEIEKDAPFPSRIPTLVKRDLKTSTPNPKTKIRNEIEQLELSTKDEETSEGCGVINVFHQDCTSAQAVPSAPSPVHLMPPKRISTPLHPMHPVKLVLHNEDLRQNRHTFQNGDVILVVK